MSIVTPVGRLSFPNIFEPKPPSPGAAPKYSATLLLEKTDPEVQKFMPELKKKMDMVIREKWPQVDSRPGNLIVAIKDGDNLRFTVGEHSGKLKKERYPEFGGHWVISASSKQAPGIVDAQCQEVMDVRVAYAGVRARISFNLFAYNNVNVGIGCGLNNVMIVGGGDPFGNATRPQDDFAKYFSEAESAQAEGVQTEDVSAMFG